MLENGSWYTAKEYIVTSFPSLLQKYLWPFTRVTVFEKSQYSDLSGTMDTFCELTSVLVSQNITVAYQSD